MEIHVIALCNKYGEQRIFTLAISVSRQPLCNFLSPSDPSPHCEHYSHIGCLGVKKIDSPPATISLSLLFSRAPFYSLFLSSYRWLASFNPPFSRNAYSTSFFLKVFEIFFMNNVQGIEITKIYMVTIYTKTY